ncbi:MAG: fructosamine kinase family protein [Thiogranum sp.]
MSVWRAIEKQLQEVLGEQVRLSAPRAVGGGSINQSCRVSSGQQSWFVKLNRANMLDMFAAEAEGLEALREADALCIPQPLCRGQDGQQAWLVMDYLETGGSGSSTALAEGLAAVHRIRSTHFGWHRDNTIGSTPQINTQEADWLTFWREHRLAFQLQLAARNGAATRALDIGEQVLIQLPALLDGHEPEASLLHGDLWSGNYAFTRDGRPTIFDPAVYFGDREADLAMTELFGGFSRDFHAAYRNAWPLDSGYPLRRMLYNLYHVLNHFNLFGGGYLSQAQGMMESLLSEVR